VRLPTPSSSTSHRPNGSPLPSFLCSTYLRLVLRLSEGCGSSFVLPGLGQVGGSSWSTPCLHFDLLDLHSRSSMSDFMRAWRGFLLLDPGAPYTTLTTLRPRLGHYAYTSIRGFRDMSTHGSPPTRVSPVPDRRVRPTRRPADMTCGPKDVNILGVQDKTVRLR
jgi:hypothetical protein